MPGSLPFEPAGFRKSASVAGPNGTRVSLRDENQEQAFHPIYDYAVVTDAVDGLYLVNVDTLADGDPRNNFLRRAVTWNEGGVLNGARHVTLAGHYAYIAATAGLVVIDLRTGDIVHWLRIAGVVSELYDVVALPGVVRPMAFGFKTDEIQKTLTTSFLEAVLDGATGRGYSPGRLRGTLFLPNLPETSL